MINKIIAVKAIHDFEIIATFQNGISKKYDMKNLFDIFPQFKDFLVIEGLFEQVQVDVGGYGISWNDDLDLAADDIWEDGIEFRCSSEIDIVDQLAYHLVQARENSGMTQKQLAEVTGIYQADISKIERGLANPSLSTIKRLADGLGMKIKLIFE